MKAPRALREREHARQNNKAKRYRQFIAADMAYGRVLITGCYPPGTTQREELDRLERLVEQRRRDWLENTPIERRPDESEGR